MNFIKKLNFTQKIDILSIVLSLVSIAYLLKGFSFLLPYNQGAGDLYLRWQEQQYIYQGYYPYFAREGSDFVIGEIGAITSGGYLPWSFFSGFLFFPPISYSFTRIYHIFLNLISLSILSLFAYNLGKNYHRSYGLFAVASVLAISANCTTLGLGQYGLIVNAFSQCLESLKKSSVSPLEVIVVVDGIDPESYQTAIKFTDQVLQLDTNKGTATARNKGADIARGDILFFMDADVTIHHDTLAKILEVFQANPEVSAIIGSYDDSPNASNFISQYKNLFHHYNHQISSEEASTFWGACGAIKKDVFLKIGGFNQNYRFPSVEDIELGYRLKKNNKRILLCKDIYVKHLKKWTVYSLLRADFFYRALPWTELIHQNSSFTNDLNLKYSSRISVILVYLFLILLSPIIFYPSLIFINITLVIILIFFNLPVYKFFYQKRGLIFTLKVLPWHWIYYFYSGLGFAFGTANFWLKKKNNCSNQIINMNNRPLAK